MEGEEIIREANENDVSEVCVLVNSAYRGESSKKGWATEADLLGGIRTDEKYLSDLIKREGSVILLYTSKEKILACVHLHKQDKKLHLGMLAVSPGLQANGIGKKLLKASEDYAASHGLTKIDMTVISVRHELIKWYERRGYALTGETKPFPAEDPRFGIPKRHLEFVVMEKTISDV